MPTFSPMPTNPSAQAGRRPGKPALLPGARGNDSALTNCPNTGDYWNFAPAKCISVKPGRIDLRSAVALMKEMNLLLASLRRVEVRIEPQTITDFLKWKNRMAEYNGGQLPEGITAPDEEPNPHLVI